MSGLTHSLFTNPAPDQATIQQQLNECEDDGSIKQVRPMEQHMPFQQQNRLDTFAFASEELIKTVLSQNIRNLQNDAVDCLRKTEIFDAIEKVQTLYNEIIDSYDDSGNQVFEMNKFVKLSHEICKILTAASIELPKILSHCANIESQMKALRIYPTTEIHVNMPQQQQQTTKVVGRKRQK